MAVKAHTVVESFSSAPSNPPWLLTNGAAFTGGRLVVPNTPSSMTYGRAEYTADRVDLTESSLYFEIVDRGNQSYGQWQCKLMFVNAARTMAVGWVMDGNNIRLVNDPTGQIVSGPYDVVNYKWLRLRVTGAAYFLESSTNGTAWNLIYSAALTGLGMAVSDVILMIEAGTYNTGLATSTSFVIDNINMVPTPTTARFGSVQLDAAMTGLNPSMRLGGIQLDAALTSLNPSMRVGGVQLDVAIQNLSVVTGRKRLRTVGSSRPVQMRWPDNQWREVELT
jgi:hypothetical protein